MRSKKLYKPWKAGLSQALPTVICSFKAYHNSRDITICFTRFACFFEKKGGILYLDLKGNLDLKRESCFSRLSLKWSSWL